MMKSVEENVGAEYVRNPDYWKPGLPYLDGFRTRAFADTAGGLRGISRPARLISPLVPGAGGRRNTSPSRGRATTRTGIRTNDGTLLYPNTKVKPMDDPASPGRCGC